MCIVNLLCCLSRVYVRSLTFLLAHSIGMRLCNREASVVRLSVNFYTQVATSTTHMSRSPPNSHMGLHPGCAQGQDRGQRSRDTGTSVMSRNVCYTVPSDVLSLHAFTLRSTVTSVQYKCQTARCNVYIME